VKEHVTMTAPTPPVILAVTRYAVSVFDPTERDHRYYALHVELRPRGWVVTDGHAYYGPDGATEPSASTAHHYPHDDHAQALALAAELAPHLEVNGITAAEAHHDRSHSA
jgi:hypothetical protein